MAKKNHSASVDIMKYLNFARENKIYIWALIIFMLTFKWGCDNKSGEVKYYFGCHPLRISDVKEFVK